MQPGEADEEFVLEQLQNIWQKAYNDAMFELVAAIAKHVGIAELDGLSIGGFLDRRKREIAENLVADMADTFPALASQIKRAWEQFDREQA